jgi:hypothetical protein
MPRCETAQDFRDSQALLPAARGRFAAGASTVEPDELPMFARHKRRTGARKKWAVRGAARRWCRKLKPQLPSRQPESRSSGWPVCCPVRTCIRVSEAIVCYYRIYLPRGKCRSALGRRQKNGYPTDQNKSSAHRSPPSERNDCRPRAGQSTPLPLSNCLDRRTFWKQGKGRRSTPPRDQAQWSLS